MALLGAGSAIMAQKTCTAALFLSSVEMPLSSQAQLNFFNLVPFLGGMFGNPAR